MKASRLRRVPECGPRLRERGQLAHSVLCLTILAALPSAVMATDLNYELGLGFLHSDNLNFSETDPSSEDVALATLRFAATREGSAFRMHARGSLQYLDYLGNSYPDELRGDLAGQIIWSLLPGRVDWVFEDYLSRQPIDILTGLVPTNQQQVNLFVTGPSLYLRLGGATQAQLDLRYTNSYAEETKDFNGNRVTLAARLIREINSTNTVSGNFEVSTINFTNESITPDYRRYDGFLRYQRKLPVTDLQLDLGYTRLDPSAGRPSASAPLVRAEMLWHASPRIAFNARLEYQFADAAQDLIRSGTGRATEAYSRALDYADPFDAIAEMGGAEQLVSGAVYRERRVQFDYQYSGDRLDVTISPYSQSFRYSTELNPGATDLDQHNHGQGLSLDYRLRPQMSLTFTATHEQRAFRNQGGRSDEDTTASLALSRQTATHWRWRLEVQHRKRESSQPGAGFTENSIVAAIVYRG